MFTRFSIESALADELGDGVFEGLDVCDVLAVHDMVGEAPNDVNVLVVGDAGVIAAPEYAVGVTDGDSDSEPVSE